MRNMQLRKFILYFATVCFVLFSFGPTFYELSRADKLHADRHFELVHNFPTDYNFYLSRIRQGLEGRWTAVERYTSEPHDGSFVHEFYILLGQSGRFSRVPLHRPGDIYHVARFVLAIAMLAVVAVFVQQSLAGLRQDKPFWVFIAFLLAVTASSWPKLLAVVDTTIIPATFTNMQSWRFGGYMSWWSVMDSLQRITFIPHLLAGQGLIIAIILLVTRKEVVRQSKNVVFIGLLSFILGMIFPPGLLFVYVVMGIWVMFLGWKREWIVPYAAIVMTSVASLVYLALMTGVYPWKRLAEVDIIRPLPFDYIEYGKAMGPLLPLGILGLIVALYRWETMLFPAVSWVLGWGLLLGVFAFIPQQSPLRFSEMVPHVPLGVLTAYLFYVSRKYLSAPIAAFFPVVLVIIGLFHMYSSYLWQRDFVDHKIRATLPLVPTGSYVMYPLKDFVSGMQFIYDHGKGNGVVLSETTAGNYIPAYIGHVVYAGHDNTVAFEGKKEKVREFFAGNMQETQARDFVATTGAAYIFFGPQEREDGGVSDLKLKYPFLKEVYRNNQVIVYIP